MLSVISAFFDELEPVEILRAGALVLFFIGSVFVNKKRQTWFQGETIAMTVGGLMWVLVPEVLLEIQVGHYWIIITYELEIPGWLGVK